MPYPISDFFKKKHNNIEKLLQFGFMPANDRYIYCRSFPASGFLCTVTVTKDGAVSAAVIDPACNEEYTLHLAEQTEGTFVGEIKRQYEETLQEIAAACFDDEEQFHTAQAKALTAYMIRTYGDSLEFLWKKFPQNAIWRRKDTGKWYGLLAALPMKRLIGTSDTQVEIINLRIPPEELLKRIDYKSCFPAYHMSKHNWITILLNDTIPIDDICRRIDRSYQLAVDTGKKR